MGKSTPSPPPAPDPAAVAQAQGAANREAAIAGLESSLIDQTTPFGAIRYSPIGETEAGNPRYSATQTLSPEQQQLLDLQTATGRRYGETAGRQLESVSDRLSVPLDFSGLGPPPAANADVRAQTAEAMLARLEPQFARDQDRFESRMAAQGITPGSEAWQRSADDITRGRTDARLAVDARAGDEMARLFGLESAERDKAINELIMGRTQPLNELAAMTSGAQVQAPSFVGTPQAQVAPTDVTGPAYASANLGQNIYGQNLANQRSTTRGLFDLFGTGLQAGALAWSDRRLKCDVEQIGDVRGLQLYEFRYVAGGPRHVGFMADEVREVCPEAVQRIGGFDAVDYRRVLECL